MEGKIQHIIYRNIENMKNYAIFTVNKDSTNMKGEIKIKGNCNIFPENNDYFYLPEYDVKYNKQFNCYEYNALQVIMIEYPKNKKDIEERLEDKCRTSGMGKVTTEKIVNMYEENIWDILRDKNKMLEINTKKKMKIKKEILEELNEKYIKYDQEKRSQFESSHVKNFRYFIIENEIKLSKKVIENIIELYDGQNIIDIVYNDTCALMDAKGMTIKTIIEIIDKLCFPIEKRDYVIIYCILYQLIKLNGHSCYPKEDFYEYSENIFDDKKTKIYIKKLLEEKKIVELCCNDRKYLYFADDYDNELMISDTIKKYMKSTDKIICDDETIDDVINEKDIILTDEQKLAIQNIFNNKLSIISGLPGTGKTLCIKKIVNICKINNTKCILLAPTGKAVCKIKEAVYLQSDSKYVSNYRNQIISLEEENNDDIVCITIHRFCLAQKYKEDIQNKMIIIDESSMLDNKIMGSFFSILNNRKFDGNIVFMGDHNQLPPIETGCFFKQIIDSGLLKINYLNKIMRQDEQSILNLILLDILNKKVPKIDSECYKFIDADNAESAAERLYETLNELLNIREISFDNIMVITPTNKNIKLCEEKIRKLVLGDKYTNEYTIDDKVMQLKNFNNNCQPKKFPKKEYCNPNFYSESLNINLNKELFNGMCGKICKIERINKKDVCEVAGNRLNTTEKQIFCTVKFNDDLTYTYTNEDISMIRLAYIGTVHKYQGSENDIVIILLTSNDWNLLNNNMIYTAISRTKKKCIVIGSEHIYSKAITTNIPKRYSNICYFLQK